MLLPKQKQGAEAHLHSCAVRTGREVTNAPFFVLFELRWQQSSRRLNTAVQRWRREYAYIYFIFRHTLRYSESKEQATRAPELTAATPVNKLQKK